MRWLKADMFLQDDNKNLIAVIRIKENDGTSDGYEDDDTEYIVEIKVNGCGWRRLNFPYYDRPKHAQVQKAAEAYLREIGILPDPETVARLSQNSIADGKTPERIPREIAQERRLARKLGKPEPPMQTAPPTPTEHDINQLRDILRRQKSLGMGLPDPDHLTPAQVIRLSRIVNGKGVAFGPNSVDLPKFGNMPRQKYNADYMEKVKDFAKKGGAIKEPKKNEGDAEKLQALLDGLSL